MIILQKKIFTSLFHWFFCQFLLLLRREVCGIIFSHFLLFVPDERLWRLPVGRRTSAAELPGAGTFDPMYLSVPSLSMTMIEGMAYPAGREIPSLCEIPMSKLARFWSLTRGNWTVFISSIQSFKTSGPSREMPNTAQFCFPNSLNISEKLFTSLPLCLSQAWLKRIRTRYWPLYWSGQKISDSPLGFIETGGGLFWFSHVNDIFAWTQIFWGLF